MTVEPQETETRAQQGGTKYEEFTRFGYIGQKKVPGPVRAADDIGHTRKGQNGNDGDACRQTVQPVGKIHRVRYADNHQYHEQNKEESQGDENLLQPGNAQFGVQAGNARGNRLWKRGLDQKPVYPNDIPFVQGVQPPLKQTGQFRFQRGFRPERRFVQRLVPQNAVQSKQHCASVFPGDFTARLRIPNQCA